jgi:hypothetical protein
MAMMGPLLRGGIQIMVYMDCAQHYIRELRPDLYKAIKQYLRVEPAAIGNPITARGGKLPKYLKQVAS